jgi:tetrahydromethanopterin S-methyltransferase subunit D
VGTGKKVMAAGAGKKPVMPAAALIQKKAPRRGIRLKTDADDGPSYD